MHSVDEVDIRGPGFAEHGAISFCGTTEGMTSGIARQIGLCFHNSSHHAAFSDSALKKSSEECFSYRNRRPFKEILADNRHGP